MMQTDVKSAHLANTAGGGILVPGPNRLKGILYTSGTSAGTVNNALNIWDTVTAPTATTSYVRSSAGLVTVTLASHGLNSGDIIGLTFGAATGGYATNGNYVVTALTSSTYTVQDINIAALTSGAPGFQTVAGGRWLFTLETAATTTSGQPEVTSLTFPGEGIKVNTGILCTMGTIVTHHNGVTVFYG